MATKILRLPYPICQAADSAVDGAGHVETLGGSPTKPPKTLLSFNAMPFILRSEWYGTEY